MFTNDRAAAIAALHYYRNTIFATDADRAAVERAVADFAEASGIGFGEATRKITADVLEHERQERNAAERDAYLADRNPMPTWLVPPGVKP